MATWLQIPKCIAMYRSKIGWLAMYGTVYWVWSYD